MPTALQTDDFDDDPPESMATPNLPVARTGIAKLNPIDPSLLGFPPMLPVELAMRTDTPANICAAYGVTREEFVVIIEDPVFAIAFTKAKDMLQKDGASFKVKAKLQAEALLQTAWNIVHNAMTPAAVKADLIKAVVRWAEYEPKKDATGNGGGGQFNIQINLG